MELFIFASGVRFEGGVARTSIVFKAWVPHSCSSMSGVFDFSPESSLVPSFWVYRHRQDRQLGSRFVVRFERLKRAGSSLHATAPSRGGTGMRLNMATKRLTNPKAARKALSGWKRVYPNVSVRTMIGTATMICATMPPHATTQ